MFRTEHVWRLDILACAFRRLGRFSHTAAAVMRFFRIGGLCVPSVCWVRGERWDLQKLDACLDHEPGRKGFKGINREWTPMDANWGALNRKDRGGFILPPNAVTDAPKGQPQDSPRQRLGSPAISNGVLKGRTNGAAHGLGARPCGTGVKTPIPITCVPSARGVHGELGPPELDASLDHEPGCKGFK